MKSVNIKPLEGYEIIIASGHPKLTAGPKDSVKFFSEEKFVLHLMKDGHTMGIVTPGGE